MKTRYENAEREAASATDVHIRDLMLELALIMDSMKTAGTSPAPRTVSPNSIRPHVLMIIGFHAKLIWETEAL